MKKKIVGILVMTLLIVTAYSSLGLEENTSIIFKNYIEFESQPPPASWLKGSDQKQTTHCKNGFVVQPSIIMAQEFKPTKDILTAVALNLFEFGEAPQDIEITLSIREELEGNDLAIININADSEKITKRSSWELFDFDDITVIPEEIYYIVCTADGGGLDNNTYCWLFDIGNKYDRGIAWQYNYTSKTWVDLEDPFQDPEYPDWIQIDLCFITYYQEPKSKTITTPFLSFLENHPHLFTLLRQILGL